MKGKEKEVDVLQVDFREMKKLAEEEQYDVVIFNPPYVALGS